MIAASHIINHTLIHSPVPNFRHGTKSEVLTVRELAVRQCTAAQKKGQPEYMPVGFFSFRIYQNRLYVQEPGRPV